VADLPPRPSPPLTLGISDCLLGSEVRYDGSGAKSSFPHTELEGTFAFRGICPEVGIGMGIPRPPIRLVKREVVRAVGVDDGGDDYTRRLSSFGMETARSLDGVSGYVFMKGSPSCGLFRVKVYPEKDGRIGPARRDGRGIYAQALSAALPDLPMEENGRLHDPLLRENFVMRTFVYAHWQALLEVGLTASRLIEFHSRYRYLLMAHSVGEYQQAGYLLSHLAEAFDGKGDAYISTLMRGLARPASRGGHANVLAHLQGFLNRKIDDPSRQELATLISAYLRSEQPLPVLLGLLKAHLRHHPEWYLVYQTYLEPHPAPAPMD